MKYQVNPSQQMQVDLMIAGNRARITECSDVGCTVIDVVLDRGTVACGHGRSYIGAACYRWQADDACKRGINGMLRRLYLGGA